MSRVTTEVEVSSHALFDQHVPWELVTSPSARGISDEFSTWLGRRQSGLQKGGISAIVMPANFQFWLPLLCWDLKGEQGAAELGANTVLK